MSDIKRLLAIMNENTVAGGVATVAAPMGEMQKRVEETQEESAKAPEVIEYGMWENSALATTSKLKKNRDKSAKVVKSIYGEDVQSEAANPKQQAAIAIAKKKEVAEGKFTINAKTGAKLDPRTGVELPPKEKPLTMKDMFRQPKSTSPKLSLDDVWRKVEDVVGQIFPDGDPIDYLAPWLEKHGIRDFKIGEILDRAAKKNGYKDLYDYYDSMKDQYDRDNVAEAGHQSPHAKLAQLKAKYDAALKSPNPNMTTLRRIRDEIIKLEFDLGLKEGVAEGSEDPSYKKGWKLCDKDPSADPQHLFRKHGEGLDRNQFIKGFNDNAKSRGMKIHGDVSGDVDHSTLRYKEFKRDQGVAEGSEDRKTAPGWHSDSVKNPNFNDELSGRRVSPPGKRLKSGKLSADERGSQERTKALMKFKKAQGGLTGPKGVLPEQDMAESISIKSTDDNYNIVNSKGEVIKQFHKTTKGLEYAKQFLKQNKGNTGLDENTVAEGTLEESDLILNPAGISKRVRDLVSKEQDRTDHEVEMAKNDLYQCGKNASQIFKMIRNVSEEEGLEGWVQEKIIKAADYLNTVREYLEGKMMESADGVAQSTKMFTSEEKPGLWANIHAKRERIKKGSGERMRTPGSKGAPTSQAFKDSAKTSKK